MEDKIERSRKEIYRLHRILFPLNKGFNYDYVKAIKDIQSEIKTLCEKENVVILFMLAGALEINPELLSLKMDMRELCSLLLTKVSDFGLSLSESEKTLLLLPVKNIDLLRDVCSELLYKGPIISTFYADYSSFLYEFKKDFLDKNYLDENNRYYMVGPMGPLLGSDIISAEKDDLDLIRKYINFDVNTHDLLKVLNAGENVYRRDKKYTWQQADFIIRVHNGFRNGKIPLDITKEELCKNIRKYL